MNVSKWMVACCAALGMAVASLPASAQGLFNLNDGMSGRMGPPTVPAGVKRIVDVPYGQAARQAFDVYVPEHPRGPVLVMVHGGAWMIGNKAMPNVVDSKIAHWVRDQGWILVSVGYRLVPSVTVAQQGQDIAKALAAVQAQASGWGGDASQLVLMGHSAGAHLVALVSASSSLARQAGVKPWRGTVVLDSAALDTSALMGRRHMRFYDSAFGSDPSGWAAASPTDSLDRSNPPPPLLLVCSLRRGDDSCGQSGQFAQRVHASGGRAEVLPEDLTHAQINAELGLASGYTQAVDAFIGSLGLR